MKNVVLVGSVFVAGLSFTLSAEQVNSVVLGQKFKEVVVPVGGQPSVAVSDKPVNDDSQSVPVSDGNVEVFAIGSGGVVEPVAVVNSKSDNIADRVLSVSNTTHVDANLIIDGPYRYYKDSGRVEFSLSKGLLKPQVINLLLRHQRIDAIDDIQWQASDNFMWPNSYTLADKSIDHVIHRLLKPYKLVAVFRGNGTVIIKKM